MTAVRADQRYELKYLVHHTQAAELAAALAGNMLPDEHADSRGGYLVTSLYYDTADHKAYWDKIDGHRNRRKLRVRIYGDRPVTPETPCFVEIKHRLDRALQKRRVLLPYGAAADLDRIDDLLPACAGRERAVLEEVEYLHRALRLQPACVVSYRRRAFEGREYDPGLRVTFDADLKYRTHELNLYANGGATDHYFLSPDWCIMEVKVNHRAPLWLTEVIGMHQCVIRRISKYCAALEHGKLVLSRQRIHPNL
jgi:SPX domain protein involved in polyphosphate accumulation